MASLSPVSLEPFVQNNKIKHVLSSDLRMAVAMAVSSEWPSDLPRVVCDPGCRFNAGAEGGPAGTGLTFFPREWMSHSHTHTTLYTPRSMHGLPYCFTDSYRVTTLKRWEVAKVCNFHTTSTRKIEIRKVARIILNNSKSECQQQFSMGDCAPRGHSVMSGDILVTTTRGEGCCWLQWLKARDAAKPTVHRTAPQVSDPKCH